MFRGNKISHRKPGFSRPEFELFLTRFVGDRESMEYASLLLFTLLLLSLSSGLVQFYTDEIRACCVVNALIDFSRDVILKGYSEPNFGNESKRMTRTKN